MMNEFDFGLLKPWIEDELVTDINYNGRQCWIDHLKKGRFALEPFYGHEFMNQFCYKMANYVNLPFNTSSPVLEAETSDLRISMVHQSVCRTGTSISIRKTPAVCRLVEKELIKQKYAPAWVLKLLRETVEFKCNLLVSGLPGAGKTEFIKYLMQYIPASQRVITIEDTLELRYGDIHPSKDNVMMKVHEGFDYQKAIKTSLRQRPDWICVSEVRGVEVVSLLQSVSTGASLLSTIHAESAQSIPQRILHMLPGMELTNQVMKCLIHDTLDFGVHLEMYSDATGIHRCIREVVYFSLDEQQKPKTTLIYEKNGSSNELIRLQDLLPKGWHR